MRNVSGFIRFIYWTIFVISFVGMIIFFGTPQGFWKFTLFILALTQIIALHRNQRMLILFFAFGHLVQKFDPEMRQTQFLAVILLSASIFGLLSKKDVWYAPVLISNHNETQENS